MKQKALLTLIMLVAFTFTASAQVLLSPELHSYIGLVNQGMQDIESSAESGSNSFYVDKTYAPESHPAPSTLSSQSSSSKSTHKLKRECTRCNGSGICKICNSAGQWIAYVGAEKKTRLTCNGSGKCGVCHDSGYDGYRYDCKRLHICVDVFN